MRQVYFERFWPRRCALVGAAGAPDLTVHRGFRGGTFFNLALRPRSLVVHVLHNPVP
jgi:hypothetical protein